MAYIVSWDSQSSSACIMAEEAQLKIYWFERNLFLSLGTLISIAKVLDHMWCSDTQNPPIP